MADSLPRPGFDPGGEPDPLQPVVVNRPPRALGNTLRIVAFNACGCRQPRILADWLRRPPLAGAGAILLSEVDWRLPRSAMRETAAELAEELSMSVAFGPAFAFAKPGEPFSGFFGNAILSAMPLTRAACVPLPILFDWARTRMPGNPRRLSRRIGQRGGLVASVALRGKSTTLGVVHLENHASPAGRAGQIAHFLRSMPPSGAAVIGGDFNTTTIDLSAKQSRPAFIVALLVKLMMRPWRMRQTHLYEPLFEELARAGFSHRGANSPGRPTFVPNPVVPPVLRPRLDWIVLRELDAIADSARVVSARHGLLGRLSDHEIVMCDIAL